MLRLSAWAVLSLAALAGAAVFMALRPADHGGVPAASRTVIVAAGDARLPGTPFFSLRDCLGNPASCVNGADGVVLTYAVGGSAPEAREAATVLTDENCEPDRHGVSHCLNRLRLAGGRVLTVRHDHNMANDPCLSPGEQIVVQPLRV